MILRRSSIVLLGLALATSTNLAQNPAYENYRTVGSFTNPGSGLAVAGDGRLLTLDGNNLQIETAVGSRSFTTIAALPALPGSGDLSFGPAFLTVSPDGTRVAVGNNGGGGEFYVGVFDIATATGNWFAADHLTAAWADNTTLLLNRGSFTSSSVTALDTTSATPLSPANPTVVDNIPGASSGIGVDAAGNLYVGNGFASGTTPFGAATGQIKAIDDADWQAAIGGSPVDFLATGQPIADLLSAGSLTFDAAGNFLIAGGDAFGSGEGDFFAVVSDDAIADALAGLDVIDAGDLNVSFRAFDPDPAADSFYSVTANTVTGELYATPFGGDTFVLIPEPATLALLAMGGFALRRRGGNRR